MLIGYIFNILLRILYDITSIHTKNELHHKKSSTIIMLWVFIKKSQKVPEK